MQPEALKFYVFDPIIFHYFTIILIIFELLALLQNKKIDISAGIYCGNLAICRLHHRDQCS